MQNIAVFEVFEAILCWSGSGKERPIKHISPLLNRWILFSVCYFPFFYYIWIMDEMVIPTMAIWERIYRFDFNCQLWMPRIVYIRYLNPSEYVAKDIFERKLPAFFLRGIILWSLIFQWWDPPYCMGRISKRRMFFHHSFAERCQMAKWTHPWKQYDIPFLPNPATCRLLQVSLGNWVLFQMN